MLLENPTQPNFFPFHELTLLNMVIKKHHTLALVFTKGGKKGGNHIYLFSLKTYL
jgi:hypothetical protein